eukprot:SAG11_NODE_4695_length_1803_cov_1.308099_3_plen_104_part_00
MGRYGTWLSAVDCAPSPHSTFPALVSSHGRGNYLSTRQLTDHVVALQVRAQLPEKEAIAKQQAARLNDLGRQNLTAALRVEGSLENVRKAHETHGRFQKMVPS